MKLKFLYAMTVISAGLALLTFWAGIILAVLSVRRLIATSVWTVAIVWFMLLIVFVVLTAVFYSLAYSVERNSKRDK